MYYLDTSVLPAYSFSEDECHNEALDIIENKLQSSKFIISTYTIIELYATFSRQLDKYKLPFGNSIPDEEKVLLLIKQCLEDLDVEIQSEEFGKDQFNLSGRYFRVNHSFKKAMELSPELKLNTGDILHLGYIISIEEKSDRIINGLASVDQEFEKKGEKIKNIIDLDIVTPTYLGFWVFQKVLKNLGLE